MLFELILIKNVSDMLEGDTMRTGLDDFYLSLMRLGWIVTNPIVKICSNSTTSRVSHCLNNTGINIITGLIIRHKLFKYIIIVKSIQ